MAAVQEESHILEDDAKSTADAVASARSNTMGIISSKPVRVFSYGSNSTRQLCERLGRMNEEIRPDKPLPFEAVPAILHGYKRIFAGLSKRWGGAVASCHPHSSGQVFGLLVTLNEEELAILDSYEIGYSRETCSVVANGSSFEAFIYLKQDLNFSYLPSESYMQAIERMLREANHPAEHIEVCRADEDGSVQVVDIWNAKDGFTMVEQHSYCKY